MLAIATTTDPPHRWHPDEMLLDATLDGRITGHTLTEPDRAWIVATLTHRGEPAETIAARLQCSERTIHVIRAQPITILCNMLLDARHEADQATTRLRHAERRHRHSLDHANNQLAAARASRATLIEQLRQARHR